MTVCPVLVHEISRIDTETTGARMARRPASVRSWSAVWNPSEWSPASASERLNGSPLKA
jgi:hypothetical protein